MLIIPESGIDHELLWDDLAMDGNDTGIIYDWLWTDLATVIATWVGKWLLHHCGRLCTCGEAWM